MVEESNIFARTRYVTFLGVRPLCYGDVHPGLYETWVTSIESEHLTTICWLAGECSSDDETEA